MSFNNFNGFFMSKDVVLAEIQNGEITNIFNDKLLPIYIARTNNVEHWLETRAIDNHRANSRLLKKVLRLADRDDVSTALSVNAVTITDTYWIKPKDSSLTWEDVRFKENYFSDLALRGDLSAFSQKPSRTPELTNIGSFEKSWKLENGRWWLYKCASEYELFSELFIYHLGKELGFSMAHYEAADGYIRSLDFTNAGSVNYESAYSWIGDNDDYVPNYRALEKFGDDILDQYVEMILLDSYCLNGDRHTFNYGVLRDISTGEVLRLAPNFDNNIALIYKGYSSNQRKPDILGEQLHDLEKETGAISKYLSKNDAPVINEDIINRAIDATGMEANREYIQHFVRVGYEQTPVADFVSRQLSTQIKNAEQKLNKSPIISNKQNNIER